MKDCKVKLQVTYIREEAVQAFDPPFPALKVTADLTHINSDTTVYALI